MLVEHDYGTIARCSRAASPLAVQSRSRLRALAGCGLVLALAAACDDGEPEGGSDGSMPSTFDGAPHDAGSDAGGGATDSGTLRDAGDDADGSASTPDACEVPPSSDAGSPAEVCTCGDEDGGTRDEVRARISMACACAMGGCTPLASWADETRIDAITCGCGLIEVESIGGLSGESWTYELATFEQVGWGEGLDGPYGPCDVPGYEAGVRLRRDCAERQPCSLPDIFLRCR